MSITTRMPFLEIVYELHTRNGTEAAKYVPEINTR